MEPFDASLTFVRRIHRSFLHKGQWRGTVMFSLIYVGTNSWVNNRDVPVMKCRLARPMLWMVTPWHQPSTGEKHMSFDVDEYSLKRVNLFPSLLWPLASFCSLNTVWWNNYQHFVYNKNDICSTTLCQTMFWEFWQIRFQAYSLHPKNNIHLISRHFNSNHICSRYTFIILWMASLSSSIPKDHWGSFTPPWPRSLNLYKYEDKSFWVLWHQKFGRYCANGNPTNKVIRFYVMIYIQHEYHIYIYILRSCINALIHIETCAFLFYLSLFSCGYNIRIEILVWLSYLYSDCQGGPSGTGKTVWNQCH